MRKNIMFLVAIAMALTAQAAPVSAQQSRSPKAAFEMREGVCILIYEATDGPNKGRFGVSDAGVVQVMRDTQKGLLHLTPPPDGKIISIMCSRSTPIPFPLDYRVILSGYDLRTINLDKTREFETLLTKKNGAYVLTMEKGELTASEKKIVDEMLTQFSRDEKEFSDHAASHAN
ncbi:MAG TPA: hypothetical protein VNH64_01660 [Parvularculaceae bacterium]|nr:hypothetical protein [Parvularculaceae bacterium]